MDSEKFFGELRNAVNQVRASDVALRESRPNTADNYRAIIDRRRNRDVLTSLISQQPEEFAGLVVALAAQVHEQGRRIEELRSAVFDSRDNIDTPLGYMQMRIEALSDRLDNMGPA